ncbi:hypothetical protein AAFF_G00388290 [Aldrovandia affinis]|uniref:Uncharacterized protein n=1 Tax=Aldrovandia affinis TaxID=143900 RepID=A0AAD7WLG4_9TELE|nr:hypothetical protein AAFF_G00388290 [Aldrovandia affinis]
MSNRPHQDTATHSSGKCLPNAHGHVDGNETTSLDKAPRLDASPPAADSADRQAGPSITALAFLLRPPDQRGETRPPHSNSYDTSLSPENKAQPHSSRL